MKFLLRVVIGAALGLVIVLVLTVLMPEPTQRSVTQPLAGFLADYSGAQFSAEELDAQFLFASLDAQQSAIAERRMLGELEAEFGPFLEALGSDDGRRQSIREALGLAYRELTDFRLAQSMDALGPRQLAYPESNNHVLLRLDSLLTPQEREALAALMKSNAWDAFRRSYAARLAAFVSTHSVPLDASLSETLVRTHFENSYALESPHGMARTSSGERLSLQRKALIATREALAPEIATEEGRALGMFIAAELRSLQEIAALKVAD